MRTAKTGHVERMIWWKGIDTMARETFDVAMLTVNRIEKRTNTVFCWTESFVRVNWPLINRI